MTKTNKLVMLLLSFFVLFQFIVGNTVVLAIEDSLGTTISKPKEVEQRLATVEVRSQQDIVDAIASNSSVALVLKNDINLNSAVTIPANHQVTLLTDGSKYSITMVATSVKQSLFVISKKAELAIDGPILLDANQKTTRAVVYCKGTFIMNSPEIIVSNFKTSTAFSGAILVEGVDAHFYLNDGVIEDNIVSNQLSAGGVFVSEGGNFEMNGGIIRGNKASEAQSGGGVLVHSYLKNSTSTKKCVSTFVMNKGEISNNTATDGGGVHLLGGDPFGKDYYSRAIMVMNGGKISKNTATGDSMTNGGGGGVLVYQGSEFTMNDGEISENEVNGMGGGVATYDYYYAYYGKEEYRVAWYDWFPASFTMNNGKIINNKAISNGIGGDGGCGGGVYSASNFVTLKAGVISGNTAALQGGGAYVGSVPYSIVLSDAVITSNEATTLGGGIWLCPTGTAKFYSQKSAAIYDNIVTGNSGAGDDIAVVRQNNKKFDVKITDRMLGGGRANWHNDGSINNSTELGTVVVGAPRYSSLSPDPVTNIEGNSLNSFALKAVPTQLAKELAMSKAKLVITNNSSRRGGGIGSNGTLILGDANSIDKAVVIKKDWLNVPNNVSLPKEITVHLEIDGYGLDQIHLTAENNWKDDSIVGLPMDAIVNVVEVNVDGFETTYNVSKSEDQKTIFITITNSYVERKVPPKTGIRTPEVLVYSGVSIIVLIYILAKKKPQLDAKI